jgi:phosphate acetyltransferase
MMLAVDDVDGLVSGAVHTTAKHGAAGLAVDQDRAGLVDRLLGLLHADARSGAGLWRLRDQPGAERRATRRDRQAERRQRDGVRHRAQSRDDQLQHRHVRRGRGRRKGARSDRDRPRQVSRSRSRRPAAVRRRVGGRCRPAEGAGQPKWPGRRRSSSSPISTPATPPTRRCSAAPTSSPSARCCKGLRKPVNDLSRGALVDDIVFTIALTAIQADTMKQT